MIAAGKTDPELEATMGQFGRSDGRAFATWFGAWFFALALLAIASGGFASERIAADDGEIYYAYAMTNRVVQDIDGTVSVQVRALRPVPN